MATKTARRSSRNKRLNFLLMALFGVLSVLAITTLVIGLLNAKPPVAAPEIAAYVNDEPITMKELDYSYQYALPDEYKAALNKWQFLNGSIIPQKLLLQEALRHNVSVSQEEVDKALDELVLLSGVSRQEFEERLDQIGLEWKDLQATYTTRLIITTFLDEKLLSTITVSNAEMQRAYSKGGFAEDNISLEEVGPLLEEELLLEKQSNAFLSYIDQLRSNASIVILLEEAKQGITSFDLTGKDICLENGSIPIYMFTSSACKECRTIAARLALLLQSEQEETFIPYLWELDTGDNLYTKVKEIGVPAAHVALFKRLAPEGNIPAYSFGCIYTRVGHLPGAPGNVNAEEQEFKAVLSTLLVQNE